MKLSTETSSRASSDFSTLKPPLLDPTAIPTLFYEPTSVLDPNLTSSPAVPPAPDLPSFPFWDFPATNPSDDLSFLFPSKDDDFTPLPFSPDFVPFPSDPSPPPPPPPPPLQQSVAVFDRTHLELLLRAAHSLDSGDLNTAHLILARLNHLFPSVSGPPLHRSALFFKDVMFSLLSDSPASEPPLSALDLVRRIGAHKAFSDLSPIPQFASFTANQTLLEALSGAQAIHLVDFDLGLGGQWSSFVQEVAARAPPPSLRLTAVVADDSPEASLATENLRDFACGLGLRLSVDIIRISALGTLALAGVRLSPSEAIAVVLTPAIFRAIGTGGAPDAASAALLRFVRRVAPRAIVFIDTEPCCAGGTEPWPSFKRWFASGIEFYSAVLDSLDAAAAATGAGENQVRRIERHLIRPRIVSSVQSCGARPTPWREMFAAGGLSPARFSEFTESQAEWLLRRAPVEGFHVARKDGSMVLSWRGKDLAATSAWKC